MGSKKKANPQFDDEIAFARHIIRNGKNFMLLPLDKDTVAQLNDDIRSHCIATYTFINSIKHILAEQKSPKSFRPIKSNEFSGIVQLDKNDNMPIDSSNSIPTNSTSDIHTDIDYDTHNNDMPMDLDDDEDNFMPFGLDDEEVLFRQPIVTTDKTGKKQLKKLTTAGKKQLKIVNKAEMKTRKSTKVSATEEASVEEPKVKFKYKQEGDEHMSFRTPTPKSIEIEDAETILKSKANTRLEKLRRESEARIEGLTHETETKENPLINKTESKAANKNIFFKSSKLEKRNDATLSALEDTNVVTPPQSNIISSIMPSLSSLITNRPANILDTAPPWASIPPEKSDFQKNSDPMTAIISIPSGPSHPIITNNPNSKDSFEETTNITTSNDKETKDNNFPKTLTFWVNLREVQINVKNPPDFKHFNPHAVLDTWKKEFTPELEDLKSTASTESLELWNVKFLTFLKKHKFTGLSNKSKKIDDPTPFHGLENKFISQYILPYLFPDLLSVRDLLAHKYYRNIKKSKLGEDIYVKMHELRIPPLGDLTSKEKIKAWLKKLRPAFYLLTNKLNFNEVYAISFCISHYSKGEYNKTIKILREHPNITSALDTGAAIFRKLAKLEKLQDKAKNKDAAAMKIDINSDNSKIEIDTNINPKKRTADILDVAPQNVKKSTLEKTKEVKTLPKIQLVNDKTESSFSETVETTTSPSMKSKVVPNLWLNIHADQPTLLKTLDFNKFNEEEVIKG